MLLELEDDFMCYVCGKKNPQGLRLDFEYLEKNKLKASVVFSKYHQGYKNIVHGGIVAIVLDEMMDEKGALLASGTATCLRIKSKLD